MMRSIDPLKLSYFSGFLLLPNWRTTFTPMFRIDDDDDVADGRWHFQHYFFSSFWKMQLWNRRHKRSTTNSQNSDDNRTHEGQRHDERKCSTRNMKFCISRSNGCVDFIAAAAVCAQRCTPHSCCRRHIQPINAKAVRLCCCFFCLQIEWKITILKTTKGQKWKSEVKKRRINRIDYS